MRLRARWLSTLVGLIGLILLAAACSAGTAAIGAPGASTTTSHPATSTHPLSVHSKSGTTPTTGATTAAVRPETCPERWGLDTPSTSLKAKAPRPGLSETLAPAGPVYLTVCRYAGLDAKVKPGSLERSRVVTGSALAAFVRLIDEPTWQKVNPGAPYGCPMATGQGDVLRFVYQSGSPVDVQVAVDGCTTASNGYRTVWVGSIVISQVAAWVGSDTLPR